jgi:hypothetical protein
MPKSKVTFRFLPYHTHACFSPGADGVFPQAQLEHSKALELQGVRAAEAGDLHTALEKFGQAISLLPDRASAYNNRAQARRLQGDVAGEGKTPEILHRKDPSHEGQR